VQARLLQRGPASFETAVARPLQDEGLDWPPAASSLEPGLHPGE